MNLRGVSQRSHYAATLGWMIAIPLGWPEIKTPAQTVLTGFFISGRTHGVFTPFPII